MDRKIDIPLKWFIIGVIAAFVIASTIVVMVITLTNSPDKVETNVDNSENYVSKSMIKTDDVFETPTPTIAPINEDNPELEGDVSNMEDYNEPNDDTGAMLSADELIDSFIRGEIDAEGIHEGKNSFNISDLLDVDEEWLKYEVGERLDLDNDGENELIMDGPYGGMILDARNGKVVILAQGEGTAGVLRIAQAPDGYWIAHCDTSHGGREVYCLDLYNGNGDIIKSEVLSAEYYDNPNDNYDKNSTFSYQDKPISMEEFENLRWELFDSWNQTISDDQ